MELKILTKVQNMYIRNNKKNGQKNIRCFPSCVPGGHRMAGFCGSNVLVSVIFPEKRKADHFSPTDSAEEKKVSEEGEQAQLKGELSEPLPSLQNTIILSEFLVDSDPKKPTQVPVVRPSIQLGSLYDCKPIMDLVKVALRPVSSPGERPCPQPFVGRLEHGSETEKQADGSYIFNIEPKCWHYGWKSHKHANKTNHFLRVYAFQKVGNAFKCVAMDDSECFTVSSSKRYRRDPSASPNSDISCAPIVKRMKVMKAGGSSP